MPASPARSRAASSRSWATIASQPIAVELVDGGVERDGADDVGRAGLLALGRVGPDHLVEVDEVDGAAAGEERVALGEAPTAGRSARRRRTVRTSCGRSTRGSRRRRACGRCGASCAASTSTGTPRAWAASMISSIGGSQPVTLVAPVIASSVGRGPASSAARDVVDAEACRRARTRRSGVGATRRAHGSRLAWCSTTVVTTTSSAVSRSRYARWLMASVVLRHDDRDVVAAVTAGEPQRGLARLLVGRGRHLRLVAGARGARSSTTARSRSPARPRPAGPRVDAAESSDR